MKIKRTKESILFAWGGQMYYNYKNEVYLYLTESKKWLISCYGWNAGFGKGSRLQLGRGVLEVSIGKW